MTSFVTKISVVVEANKMPHPRRAGYLQRFVVLGGPLKPTVLR
jgi:hypothetical protein